MGQAYNIICRDCGKSIRLSWGISYLYGWGNTELIGWIDSGKYGKEAKDIRSAHKEALCHLEDHPFICRCGYLETYQNLVIMSNNLYEPEVYYSSEHTCPECGRKMRPLRYRENVRCPDCGGPMTADMEAMELID